MNDEQSDILPKPPKILSLEQRKKETLKEKLKEKMKMKRLQRSTKNVQNEMVDDLCKKSGIDRDMVEQFMKKQKKK
jgi:hypothetical protein